MINMFTPIKMKKYNNMVIIDPIVNSTQIHNVW